MRNFLRPNARGFASMRETKKEVWKIFWVILLNLLHLGQGVCVH